MFIQESTNFGYDVSEVKNSLSGQQIFSESIKGRYYDYYSNQWESIGWLEHLIRHLFSRIFSWVDSVQISCASRSWKSIEKMHETPYEIKNRIHNIFMDSRMQNHPLRFYSKEICKIYHKEIVRNAFSNNIFLEQITIQQYFQTQNLNIFEEGKLSYLIKSCSKDYLNFYAEENKLELKSIYDTLYTSSDMRLASLKLSFDRSGEPNLKIYSGEDELLAIGEADHTKESFVFREPSTNRLLAVSIKEKLFGKIEWMLVIINSKKLSELKLPSIFLAWGILKFTQKHFSEKKDAAYVVTSNQTS